MAALKQTLKQNEHFKIKAHRKVLCSVQMTSKQSGRGRLAVPNACLEVRIRSSSQASQQAAIVKQGAAVGSSVRN